jgi:predicted tellurium resistance membrane protein TerC
MGPRQLYFLLDRLKYLSFGLAIVLAFIGVKLVMEALHSNNLPLVNGAEPITWIPEIPIELSLIVIVATLTLTTVISLISLSRNRIEAAD